MPRVDFKQIAQPYIGSPEELRDFLFPVRTTAQLAAATDDINAEDKYAGKMVWDSTLGQPVWADGAGPTDTWSLSTGIVSTTPS